MQNIPGKESYRLTSPFVKNKTTVSDNLDPEKKKKKEISFHHEHMKVNPNYKMLQTK